MRGELKALRLVHDFVAAQSQPKEQRDVGVAAPTATAPSSNAKAACNLHDWIPVEICIADYHNENDLLPSGTPNPKHWNKELAAEGQALSAKHPDVRWDRSEWNAIVAKDAEAEIEFHKGRNPAANVPDQGKPTEATADDANPGDKPNASSEIARCDAPEVLSSIRRLSDEGVKKNAFKYLIANVTNVKFELTGIRQLDYDPTSERRACAMDRKMLVTYYAHTGLAPQRKSAPIRYEIERQLDGDRGSYVTCKCD